MDSVQNLFQPTPLENLNSNDQNLIRMCILARDVAYAPYSNFKVGAALRCDDGTVYSGCNVENASYGISICAERTALVKAISEGKRKFTTIAVAASNNGQFVSPCGACRQFLSEFTTSNNDITVYLYQPNGSNVIITNVSELLPMQFKF